MQFELRQVTGEEQISLERNGKICFSERGGETVRWTYDRIAVYELLHTGVEKQTFVVCGKSMGGDLAVSLQEVIGPSWACSFFTLTSERNIDDPKFWAFLAQCHKVDFENNYQVLLDELFRVLMRDRLLVPKT